MLLSIHQFWKEQQQFISTALFQGYVSVLTFCQREVDRDIHNDMSQKTKVVIYIVNLRLTEPDEQESASYFMIK